MCVPRLIRRTVAIAVMSAVVSAAPAIAQVGVTAPAPGDPSSARPGILSKIKIDQHLDRQLPLDLPFVDDHGQKVRLGDYFGKRPVILALVYYECPMLCTQVLNGLVTALTVMNFEPGREFEVVAVSFNPREGPGLASQKKAAYVERYGRPHTANGWHFLTGEESSIKQLTEAVGFRYEYDDAIKQYAHGAAIEVLTPKGHISKYFFGIEFSARDLRLGLIEASDERIGTVIDDFLLFCYHYDPATGRYGAAVLRLVRLGGILTVLAFLSFLTISLRRDRQSQQASVAMAGPSGISALSPPDGGAQSAPARERRGVLGPRERPSRGPGRSPD
jgi:protein SCO1/2